MTQSLAGGPRPGGGPTRQQLDELDALLQRMLDLPVSQGQDEEPSPTVAPGPRLATRSPEPDLPPVRYYEPDYHEDEEDPAPPPQQFGPRVVLEAPVPGGSHELEEDEPVDPAEELARIRAAMQQQADLRAGGGPALPPTANLPTAPNPGPGEWVPLRTAWQPSAQTWKPLADRWEQTSRPADESPAPSLPPVPAPVFPQRSASVGPIVVTTQTGSAYEVPVVPPPPRIAPPQPEPPRQAAAAPTEDPTPWPAVPLVWFNAAFDVLLLPWCPKGKLLRGPAGRKFLGAVGVICLLAAAALAAVDRYGWPR